MFLPVLFFYSLTLKTDQISKIKMAVVQNKQLGTNLQTNFVAVKQINHCHFLTDC